MRVRFRPRSFMFSLVGILLLAMLVSGAVAIRAFRGSEAGYEDGPVIGMVGDQSILLAQFLQRKSAVEYNLDYTRRQVAEGSVLADAMQVYIDLIEEAGVSNVALGSLINDMALYQKALEQGFSVTEEEVEEHIAVVRDAVERGKVSPSLSGYIDAVGEDRYWNEILPDTVPRHLTILSMNRSLREEMSPESSPASWSRTWNDFQQETVEQAHIQILREDLVEPANVQDALAYLEAYWNIEGVGDGDSSAHGEL